MSDIRFYDLELNLLRILPSYSDGIGYKAVDTKQELYEGGSLEINFKDSRLKKIVEEKNADIIVSWRDFTGILSSYRWTDTENIITGTHLNGLFERYAVPATKYLKSGTYYDITATVEELAEDAIYKSGLKKWLKLKEAGADIKITYGTEEPKLLAEWFAGLCSASGCGYEIKADFRSRSFYLEIIKPNISSLLISEGNLNAYGFETTYIGKNTAYGGYYKTNDGWEYITADDTKTGLFKRDIILKSEKEADALNELAGYTAENEITATVRGLEYGRDYKIGDVIRAEKDGVIVRKLVSGINRWEEGGYYESPVMTAYNEEDI